MRVDCREINEYFCQAEAADTRVTTSWLWRPVGQAVGLACRVVSLTWAPPTGAKTTSPAFSQRRPPAFGSSSSSSSESRTRDWMFSLRSSLASGRWPAPSEQRLTSRVRCLTTSLTWLSAAMPRWSDRRARFDWWTGRSQEPAGTGSLSSPSWSPLWSSSSGDPAATPADLRSPDCDPRPARLTQCVVARDGCVSVTSCDWQHQ